MDLDPLIARVAVLRAECRRMDDEYETAKLNRNQAGEAYQEADAILRREISKQIDKLDPEG